VSDQADGRTQKIVCRMCLALCGMDVTIQGDQVISVTGDKDHPTSHGYLCPKGRTYPAQHHSPLRLSDPTIGGSKVSWSTCLQDISEQIRSLVDSGGPDQVGFYIGTGAATSDATGRVFATKLIRSLGSKQLYSAASVDIAPLYRAGELVTGFAGVFPSWDPECADDPTLAILIGFNPVVSHGYLNVPHFTDPVRRMRAYKARGGEVWVIDPRRSETATLAHHHLAVRPGTDAAVLAWLVRELLVDGADFQEIESACRPDDIELLRSALSTFDLQTVAALADVPAQDLLMLLSAVRTHRRIAVASGTGVSFGRHGIVAEWLKWVLLIITGSLDRPGGMKFVQSLPPTAFANPLPPNGAQEPGPESRPELFSLFGERPSAAIVDEIESGNLGCLFIGGGRPLTAFPNSERVRRAMKRLKMCVVVDCFENEMTELATHVLPAAWHLERRDMFFINRQIDSPPVFEPLAERKPTWWIYGQIAKYLGHDLFDGVLDVDRCTELDVFRQMHAARPDLEEIFRAGTHGVPMARPTGWVHDYVIPDGRWRIAPSTLVERLPEVLRRPDSAFRLVPNRRLRNTNAVRFATEPEGVASGPVIDINSIDANAIGVCGGDEVRLTTANGQIEGAVRIDERLRQGVIALTHGYSELNVGSLTDESELDPMTGQPQMTDIPVQITRVRRVTRESA